MSVSASPKMEMLGFTYDADRVGRIAREVNRIANEQRDYVADRRNLRVIATPDGLMLRLDKFSGPDGEPILAELRRRALLQAAGTVRIPTTYVDRLLETRADGKGGNATHAPLLAHNFNELFGADPKRHMVRVLDGRIRAFLSDAYRAIPNADLLAAALQEFQAAGAEIWDLRHTEDGEDFRICAVCPGISGQIRMDRPIDGWRWRADREGRGPDGGGDVIYPALTIGNSETGHRRLTVTSALFRAVCCNFNAWGEAVARVHLGQRRAKEEEILWSEETKLADDRVLGMKIRDQIRATFDRARFAKAIEQLNETTQRTFDQATETVDAAVDAFGLPKERREAVLEQLLRTGDKTQFGLSQALSAQANPERRGTLDDATMNAFEDAAGEVLALSGPRFAARLAR